MRPIELHRIIGIKMLIQPYCIMKQEADKVWRKTTGEACPGRLRFKMAEAGRPVIISGKT